MKYQKVYQKDGAGPQGLKFTGNWKMVLTGPDGEIKAVREGRNIVTTVGKEILAAYLASSAASATAFTMKYIAIGTDATAEAVGNTALGVEAARHTGVASYTSGAIYEVKATFATGSGTGAIVEYGLFSANTGGTMFARDVESAINKGANDTLTVTAQYTIS